MQTWIIKGTPLADYAEDADGAMEEAKRLAAENDEPYMVIQTDGEPLVYYPVLMVNTGTEYLDHYEEEN